MSSSENSDAFKSHLKWQKLLSTHQQPDGRLGGLAGSGACPGCGCAAWLVPALPTPTNPSGSDHLVVLLWEVMGQRVQSISDGQRAGSQDYNHWENVKLVATPLLLEKRFLRISF